MGSRLFKRWLHRPLRDHAILFARQDSIKNLLIDRRYLALHQTLRSVGDLARILARVALKSARPRDLVELRATLGVLPKLQQQLQHSAAPLLKKLSAEINEFPELLALLKKLF